MARHLRQPSTTAQLSDETLPTPEEARLIGAWQDELGSCRSQFQTALLLVRPDFVQALTEIDAEIRNTAILASERKLSWGEIARREAALSDSFNTKFLALNQQLDARLNAQNQIEVQNRERAAAILLQYGLQQQMINAANRPVITNCTGGFGTVNCVSH